MRDLVLDYITANPVTGFTVATKLPWNDKESPLYRENVKSIYVDQDQSVQEPLFDTLDGLSAVNETTTVSVYVATDAKNLPSTYETLVSTLRSGRIDETLTMGYTQRQTPVNTAYDGDIMITQFDYTFTKFSM